MTRLPGLPCRMLTDRAFRTPSDRSLASYFTRTRKRSTLAVGAASLIIPTILGFAPALPVAHHTQISAPAARFAAASLAGAIGDPVGIAAEAGAGLGWSGTLTFGDPTDPPQFPDLPFIPVPIPEMPAAPAPETPTEPAPAPAEPAPAPEAPPAEDAPAPETPPAEDEPAPETPPVAEDEPAPETPPAAEAAPAPVSETAPVAEAAPAPETPPAPEAAAAPAPVEDENARIEARGIRASDIARSLVGSRYRYGGTGPRSFDCSGLTLYVYRQLGIALPHKASSQFSTRYGTVISSMNNLKPGDLVFYKNTAGRGITHAAIYVGNGMMVTANSARQGVRLSSIYDSYWRKHWAGGLRVAG